MKTLWLLMMVAMKVGSSNGGSGGDDKDEGDVNK